MKAVVLRKELLPHMGGNKRQQSEPETLITFPILVQLINSKTLLANQDDSFGISASGLARVKMTGNLRPFSKLALAKMTCCHGIQIFILSEKKHMKTSCKHTIYERKYFSYSITCPH